MDKDFLKGQIQELTNQEQIAFANWQRIQGAKAFALQMLAEVEKDVTSQAELVVPTPTAKGE